MPGLAGRRLLHGAGHPQYNIAAWLKDGVWALPDSDVSFHERSCLKF